MRPSVIKRTLDAVIESSEKSPLIRKSARYVVLADIALREAPNLDADRSGILLCGEEFSTSELVKIDQDNAVSYLDDMPLDEICYMDVGGGRGWAINRNVATMDYIVKVVNTDTRYKARAKAWLDNVFRSHMFELLVMFIVCLNTVEIALQIEYRHTKQVQNFNFVAMNHAFACIYFTEMTLKLWAFGPKLYFESVFNTMDFTVTVVTLVCDLPYLGQIGVVSDVSPVLRTFRLLRLMKGIRELRLLLKSFMLSLLALLWILVFGILCFFIAACLTTVFLGQPQWLPDSAFPDAAQYRAKFKTIGMSMYTLFEVMILEGWQEAVQPLVRYRTYWVFFFMFFIFMVTYFLLNLVTAVIVDRTVAAKAKEQARKAVEAIDRREQHFHSWRQKVLELNNQQDIVSRADMHRWMEDREIASMLLELGYDQLFIDSTCAILDKQHTGSVSLSALIHQVKGVASPLDMMSLHRTHADMTVRMERQEALLLQAAGISKKASGTGCLPFGSSSSSSRHFLDVA